MQAGERKKLRAAQRNAEHRFVQNNASKEKDKHGE